MMDRRRFIATASTVLISMLAGCARSFTKKQETPNQLEGTSPPVPEPAGGHPFRVALLSDVHVQPEDSGLAKSINGKLLKAIDDLRSVQPDLWVTNGDIADHGVSSEFEAFKKIMGTVTKRDRLLVTTGNHEFYDMETTDDVSLNRFREAFGVQQPYSSSVFGGVHFVMLADEQWKLAPHHKDWCWITPEQLRWFERVLNEHKDKFTAVFMHQPLNETVVSSQGPNAFGGSNAAKELYDLIKQHKQVRLWFSGHTHRRLEQEGQVVTKEHTTFVALGSTIYQGRVNPNGGGFNRDNDASQSRLMEIYPDKVIIRARDHTEGRWMDELELNISRT